MSDRQTQRERLLALLQSRIHVPSSLEGKPISYDWVTLPEILNLRIASFTRRLHEIRKEWDVELRDEWREGQRHTAYRILGRKSLTPLTR